MEHCCICGGEPQQGCDKHIETCSYCDKKFKGDSKELNYYGKESYGWLEINDLCPECYEELNNKIVDFLKGLKFKDKR